MSHPLGVVFQLHSKPTKVVAPPEKLIPMVNFSMVCPGVYRGGYPTKKNFPFLQALHLRSVLYLCPEDYAESNLKFCEENGISVLRFPTEGNKEPFHDISEALMHRILSAICDTRNFPLLIHCNKGKHRTGTVVAALRVLQGWSLVSAFDEYKRFAADKARFGDQQYVELYHPILRLTPPFVPSWVVRSQRVLIVYTERELQEMEARLLSYSPFGNTAAAAATVSSVGVGVGVTSAGGKPAGELQATAAPPWPTSLSAALNTAPAAAETTTTTAAAAAVAPETAISSPSSA